MNPFQSQKIEFAYFFRIFILTVLFLCANEKKSVAQNSGPSLDWGFGIGSKLDDSYGGSEIDSKGNMFVSGSFQDTIDLDPDSNAQFIAVPVLYRYNKFLAKYDSSGRFIWAKLFNSKYNNYAYAIDMDKYDNIYLAGPYGDSTDVDPGPGQNLLLTGSSAAHDIFFAKYDSSGNFIWAKSIHTKDNFEWYYGLTIDNFDHIYLTGKTQDSSDFDPGPAFSNVYSSGWGTLPYIAKYDLNGNYIWARYLAELNFSMQIDHDQNIIIAGSFEFGTSYTIDTTIYYVDGTAIYYTMMGSNMWDGPNSFIAKLDSSGNYIWFNHFESGENNEINSFIIDPQNNITALGYYRGFGEFISQTDTVSFNYQGLDRSSYIVKIGSNGNYIWTKNYFKNIYNIQNDDSSNIYFNFGINNPIDLDIGPGYKLIGSGIPIGYIVKYDKDMNFIWANRYATGGNLYLNLNFDHMPAIYFGGSYHGYAYLNPDFPAQLTATYFGGQYDICFGKYSLDSCSSFFVSIDSIRNITCANLSGEIFASANQGMAPFSYSWNTTPVNTTPHITCTQPTYLNFQAIDSRGCISNTDMKIDGPYQNDFDLSVNITATAFRTGIPSMISIDAMNDGCNSQPGTIQLILDSGVIYNWANPAPTVNNGDTLIWNVANINYLNPIFHIDVSATNTLIIPGTQLTFSATVFPFSGDADTSNNRRFCHGTVVNSFDPNEKSVSPQGDGPFGKITNNQTLTYTVHFQNTGNAEAYNIAILDTLDSDLDVQSIRVVGSSHPVSNTYLVSNVVSFTFNNINLPDSTTDQLGSNGYVTYEIKQKANLPHGTELTNTAYIYFDFNPAIVTNTVLNTIDLSTSVLEKEEQENAVTIYPNPVTKSMSILLDKLDENSKVLIYDAQGKQIKLPFAISRNQIIVDTKDLQQGIYNAVITFPKTGESRSCKFIKM